MAISALGTGSGLDLNSLVEQLLQAEREPVENRLNTREERFETQLSALGLFSGALSGLRDAASGLENGTGLAQRQAVSGDESLFTATVEEGTPPGRFDIRVLGLAQADKRASAAFADGASAEVGTGTLNFTVGDDAFSINVDQDNNTLGGIRDAINRATDNTGVSAGIINEAGGARLILTGRDTGAENAINLTASGGDGGLDTLVSGFAVLTEAADAEVEIDGFTVNSSSNRIDGAIDGVTIDLAGVSAGVAEGELNVPTTSLSINENRSATLEQVRTFVDRYNALNDVLNGVASYDPETEVAGPLQGNATVRAIASQVRRELTEAVPGAALGANTLAGIGITTAEGGALRIDEGRLNEVIDQRPQALEELFGGENGVGGRLNSYLSQVVGSNSLLEGQTENLQNRIDDIGRQREALEARLERTEERLVRQFSALDSLVAELNQTSSFIEQQFANLQGGRS
ncbi:flagellar filament capping protein FliD [Wenzhouxiangella limi]|uniref:Flagellar hook-associated protein 2 n=1 Tax=Wenzhouxiangella limi TaxID=2707351 RepID=A0A845VAH0_9GAMM|nr:flagellar filament capping protein FliD [Wenzhouxiangella limi]NDY97121.1 flagellar filament capping protein FliD [Wenzhouxiangella limi]